MKRKNAQAEGRQKKRGQGSLKKPVYKWSRGEKIVGALSISMLINLLLWLIPWVDYKPGVTGRGFPLVWYTKWRAEGASPQFGIGNFIFDFLIILVVVGLIMAEYSVVSAIKERKGLK